MDIDDVEIGAAAVVGVDFVQRQRADSRRRVGVHPGQGALLGLGQDGGDGGQTDALPRQVAQTGLDAAVTGVA